MQGHLQAVPIAGKMVRFAFAQQIQRLLFVGEPFSREDLFWRIFERKTSFFALFVISAARRDVKGDGRKFYKLRVRRKLNDRVLF